MQKNPKYFEGILQLRNPTEEINSFVADEINKREDVWIAKIQKQKNGIDLYLSSNKFLKYIGKKLKNSFTGNLTESRTLFTQNRLTSKKVYRGCILFRYLDVKKGDIIDFEGEKLRIISVGKDVVAKNMVTHKKAHIKLDKIFT